MFTFTAAKAGYANLWRNAKVMRTAEAAKAAKRILADQDRYRLVAQAIGHPTIWPLIGALHDREASGSFAGVLHNGERIIGTGRKTSLVPAGRGPFPSWEAAAEDALIIKGWDKIADWPLERWLYEAERFNGWGYVGRGINSPYVWAGTSQQQPGKYVADDVWDSRAVDKQIGVAAVLKALFDLEPSASPESDVPPAKPPAELPEISSSEALAAIIKTVLPLIESQYVLLTKEQFAQLVSIVRSNSND